MSRSHLNPAFDYAIDKMDELLLEMQNFVGQQLMSVHDAFEQMDDNMAKAVRVQDKSLNELEKQVEEKVVSLLAQHHPVAQDLRHIVGTMKMAIEYERAGDYVKNLAKSISRLAAYEDSLDVFPSLLHLLEEVQKQYSNFCQASLDENVRQGLRLWIRDQKIDELCTECVREAFDNHKKGDGGVHSLIHAVSVAKNLERVGDKIKNLIEIFYFKKTGMELDETSAHFKANREAN